MNSLLRPLRVNAIALLGSDLRATRELFELLDAGAASDWSYAKALLSGRPSLPWQRSWWQKRNDPQLFWAHPTSHATGAPDLHTPLTSVLLASPRLRLAAMLQKWGLAEEEQAGVAGVSAEAAVSSLSHKKAAQKFLQLPSSSLGGLTAQRLKAHGHGPSGPAARGACAEWRLAAAQLLLEAQAGTALLATRDAKERSSLHHAAASGDVEVIRLLLRAGAARDVKDQHGRTPAHIAAVYRHADVAGELAEGIETGLDTFGHSVSGILQMHASSVVDEVDAEEFNLDTDFVRSFVSVNRPVLIKGGAMHLKAMAWSDYRHLLADLGEERMAAAPVPYAKHLGLPGAMEAPLHELLASPQIWRPESGDVEAPSYVFDATVLRRRRDVAKSASRLGTSFMERHCSHVRVPQFAVGFRGAGAPMHTHHAALNAAFAGRKRWFLCPPEAASWSLDPVATWVDSDLFQRQKTSLIELQQDPGDLLFVPEGWGHATLLESYAVAVAQEFVPWTSIHS